MVALLSAACGDGEEGRLPWRDEGDEPFTPGPEQCAALSLEEPRRFTDCSTGSGSFGRWVLDDAGLPAYDYRLDQHADDRAAYPLSERDDEGQPLERREHWAAFGNQRLNVQQYNDGMVEVITQDRGVEYLNKLDEAQGAYGGGVSWLSDGVEAWCTAYKWRPEGARTSRRFGMGYAETTLRYRGVEVTRVTAAPPGDAPVVLSDVTLENLGAEARELTHWEYWDVQRRPIEINWVVSGTAFSGAPAHARAQRDARNQWFSEAPRYEPGAQRLLLTRRYVGAEPRPAREAPSAADHYANSPFLMAALGTPADVFVDQASFFGVGSARLPEAVRRAARGMGLTAQELPAVSALGQPHAFVMKSRLRLAPHEKKTLRFVYGYAPEGEPMPDEAAWHEPSFDLRRAQAEALGERLLYFAEPSAPELQRELAWHASQLEASVGQRDYWQGPVVPQGSAYLYLHGADGAARDLGLFTVPLVYTHPELARAELRLYMGLQDARGRFSYAFQGHGMLDGAGLHTAPSDLTLFFLWALGEYLGATGDEAFLDERAPFWPREARPDATTWDHLVAALRHTFDVVGTGEHGLLRIGTGDWSDGILQEAPERQLAVSAGESVPNTQMAVAVLPRIASLVEPRAPALAAEIRAQVSAYRPALARAHDGRHYYRCYFGDGVPRYADELNLEAQVWALIADGFEGEVPRAELAQRIAEQLDEPSPLGATLLPGGEVWPAISALLTWGYARVEPTRAWDHFRRNTLAAHAQRFPDLWYGIWSGPDGVSARTGRTWQSPVTPMADFPVQNNNAHAMPLLAALKLAGVEASATGLELLPRIPSRHFTLETRLIELAQRGATLRGRYRPSGAGARTLTLSAPPGERLARLLVDGVALALPPDATRHTLTLPAGAGRALSFELTTHESP